MCVRQTSHQLKATQTYTRSPLCATHNILSPEGRRFIVIPLIRQDETYNLAWFPLPPPSPFVCSWFGFITSSGSFLTFLTSRSVLHFAVWMQLVQKPQKTSRAPRGLGCGSDAAVLIRRDVSPSHFSCRTSAYLPHLQRLQNKLFLGDYCFTHSSRRELKKTHDRDHEADRAICFS